MLTINQKRKARSMLVPAYHSEGKHSKDKPDTEDGGPGQAPRSGPGPPPAAPFLLLGLLRANEDAQP